LDLLLDLNDESAASIMDSADWVIASLRIYRGTLKKKIYFEDSVEGLLELKHNGDELEKIIPCTADQRQSIEHLINRGKSPT